MAEMNITVFHVKNIPNQGWSHWSIATISEIMVFYDAVCENRVGTVVLDYRYYHAS